MGMFSSVEYWTILLLWLFLCLFVNTNSSPYKNKRDTRSSLPWHETSLLLHSTFCITEHLRKGRPKMRRLKTVPRNIGSSQYFHIGAVCWNWSWAFFSSLNPSELQTSVSSYRHWQSCYPVVVVLTLTTSTTPDGYQCTFVTCVNSEASDCFKSWFR